MKNKKLLVLVPFLLLMASCDDKNNSNSTSNSANQTTGSWSNEIKAVMQEVLGEELPYVALDANTVQYGKDSDENGEYFYLSDSSTTSIVETYKSTLVSNGYTLSSTDNDYGYDIFIYTKDTIVVQLDYFPGGEIDGETYEPGNEIYAWLDLPTQRTDLTDWPEELKTMMTSTFNKPIPFVALATDFEYSLDGDVLTISDASDTDFLSDGFGESLVKAGFSKSTGSENYETYKLVQNESSYISVEFAFSEGYPDYGIPGGNEIYVTLNHVTKTWPAEIIRNIYSNLSKVTVPSFDITSAGSYEYYATETTMLVTGDVSSDITNDYLGKLGENNFMTDEDYFGGKFYYDWEEYVNVLVQYSSPKFMVQVSAVERGYDELVESFPTDKIKDLLGEDASEVPSVANKYGDNIKYAFVEANESFDTPACIQLTYKENSLVSGESVLDSYIKVLETAGWTVDDSYLEEYGEYFAVSPNNDVSLEFYSSYDKFVLYIQSAESSSTSDGEWNSELKALMIELLGEEIPYVALDSETISYSKKNDNDGSGDYILICDSDSESIVDEYKTILEANGYTLYKSVKGDYGNVIYVYTKGNIVVQFTYYPEDDEYYSENDIIAYVAEE